MRAKVSSLFSSFPMLVFMPGVSVIGLPNTYLTGLLTIVGSKIKRNHELIV